ncbi:UDP-2,3-diacylglucosamine diphosphatase [Stutzerimonas tarimensis]|uniref:UDP-2,3-diacylglucosamine hydrolase n=1 Tax=Stutzerimonas tarimensis TaxID=1507735 RepID=A0ABV7T4S3_9GAMM
MTVLFISDLHLETDRPDITRAFLRFLEARAPGAEAVYILGDLFEVWIGDDAMDEMQHRVAAALRRLAGQGTQVYVMHGNRDFLIGQAFCRLAGCTLLPEGSIVRVENEAVLLMHGDSLCTLDEGYQRLRRRLRNRFSLWLLPRLPLGVRRRLARKLRNASQNQTRQKASEIVDVTPAAVRETMTAHGVGTLIHGHTHRPAIHEVALEQGRGKRIVLGDWDRQGWVLEADRRGFRLESFPLS